MVFKKNNFVFSQVFQDRLHMNTKVLLQCLEQSKNPAKTLGIRSRYILGFFQPYQHKIMVCQFGISGCIFL